jgi:hypothetical protein
MIDQLQTLAIIIIPVIEFFGIKKYTDSYMSEKGKNLATKEDIREITKKTEEVKASFQNLQFQKQQIYTMKLDTIKETLDFIDVYISWLRFDRRTPERENTNRNELTIRGRKCYNKLTLTCEDSNLINMFNRILFEDDTNILENYNSYRNMARIEMGLQSPLNLDRDKIFFSRISTDDLEAKKNHSQK